MGYLLKLSDGTAALPAVTFENDLDTGLYRIGANNVGASANGAKVWEWGTGGITLAASKSLTFGDGTSLSSASGAAFIGARATKSAAQSIPTGTYTAVSWNAESYDSTAYHDNATNNSRFTVPTGKDGKHRISATINWAGNGTGIRYIVIYKNGANTLQIEEAPAASNRKSISVNTTLALVATDYIEIYAYQDSGGALDVNASGSFAEIEFRGT